MVGKEQSKMESAASPVDRSGTPTIDIESIGTTAGTQLRIPLVAAIKNPGSYSYQDLTVHWDAAPDTALTIVGNDSNPGKTQDANGWFHNSVLVSTTTAAVQTITFTAVLKAGNTVLATSSPKAIKFTPLQEPEGGFADKYLARTGGVHEDGTRIRMWLYVLDASGDGVPGVEVNWRTVPDFHGMGTDIEFYGSPGRVPDILPQPAAMVNGWPSTVTDEDGMAELYVTSNGSHYLSMLMMMNGATDPPQKDIAFLTKQTPVGSYLAPIIKGITDGLNPVPFQSTFPVEIVTSGAGTQPSNEATVMVAVAHYVDYITGSFEWTIVDMPEVTTWGALADNGYTVVPYADILSESDALADPLPAGDSTKRNGILYFVQEEGGTTTASPMTPFNMNGDPENVPDQSGTLLRKLQEVSIQPYPGTGYITTELLGILNGLSVTVPKVPAEWDGAQITLYVYCNGYYPGTRNKRRGYHVAANVGAASSSSSTTLPIEYGWLTGFAVSLDSTAGRFYCDYKLTGANGEVWSLYPDGYKMNT